MSRRLRGSRIGLDRCGQDVCGREGGVHSLRHGDHAAHTGTDNVKSLANLAMLCATWVSKGEGSLPLRGRNMCSEACDMGGLPNVYTDTRGSRTLLCAREWQRPGAWPLFGQTRVDGDGKWGMLPPQAAQEALYIIARTLSSPTLISSRKRESEETGSSRRSGYFSH